MEKMWGRQAHISEAADNDTSPGEINQYIKFAQRQVNFHCSMMCDDLKGIVNLDAVTLVTSVATGKTVGEMTMRQVLLKKFKLADGTSLIAEFHQRGTMGMVDVIVPNILEAELMILMMNRNFPAFCCHYLTGEGLDEKFVKALLKEACCPILVNQIKECTWDVEKKLIITATQAAEEARLQELENAAWYKDELGKTLVSNVKKLKSYADAEALYTLNSKRSIKTLHACNDPVEGAAKKQKGEAIKVNSSDLELSLLLAEREISGDDILMDSVSKYVSKMPMEEIEADTGSSLRVRFARRNPTSSADASAPLPLARGG